MPDFRALRALIWKELRANRALVLILAAIPPVMLEAAAAFQERSSLRDAFQYGCSVIFAMLIVMWAATKPTTDKNTAEFADTYLPVNAHVRWLASFVVPLVIVAVLGAWYGLWITVVNRGVTPAASAGAGMLMILVAFCVAYILSATISRWFALLIGTVLAILCVCSLQNSFVIEHFYWEKWAEFLASLVIGIVMFDLLLRNRPLRLRQVAALLIPIATCAIMYISLPKGGDNWWLDYQRPRIDSSEWAMYTRPISGDGRSRSVKLEFRNYRTDSRAARRFQNAVVPIGFLGEDRVFLAQQLPQEDDTAVLEWNTRSSRIRKVASLPTGKRAWAAYIIDGPHGFVRPDGKYMVLYVRSTAGDGRDFWVVDLPSGVGAIAAPNVSLQDPSIRWAGDSAVLYGRGKPIRIDLQSTTARFWTASTKGVQR